MDRKKTRRRRRRKTRKYPYLPQELIEEILSALPAKSLLRFKCVSKSWRCLINSDGFIKTQLDKSIKDPSYAHWRVTFDGNDDDDPKERPGLTQCSARSFLAYLDGKKPDIHRRPFNDSTNNHLTTPDCEIVGSCNGLLCILKKKGFLFLWNPTTRMSMELPKLDTYMILKYGFGMDEQSGAYKVFAAFRSRKLNEYNHIIGMVYSSETNSWKRVEHGCFDVVDNAGVLVGGKLYWLKKDGDYIKSFDLSSEVFGKIELPYQSGEAEDQYLVVARGMLRLNVNYVDDVWDRVRVTKDGAEEHWVKVDTKVYEETNIIVEPYAQIPYVESLVWPVPLKNH